MHLVETSLIPTVLALSDFFIQNFPHVGWYPYWYLGNPYHFLIGPVIPVILFFLNRVFSLSVTDSYLSLLLVAFIIGSLGIYSLTRSFGKSRTVAVFSGVFTFLLPFSSFLLLVQNGVHHVAFGLFPWICLLYKRFLHKRSPAIDVFLVFSFTLLFLIDVSMLLPLIFGCAALIVALRFDKKQIEYLVLKTCLVFFLSISFATLWYTPTFWLVLLANPSFGGVPLGKLLTQLFDFFLQLVPFILAVLIVKFRKLQPSSFFLFSSLFFSSFCVLTLVRFASDPDFVIDWIGFFLELQFGLSLLLGRAITVLGRKTLFGTRVLIFAVVMASFIGNIWVFKTLLFSSREKYDTKVITWIKDKVKKDTRVFLSGSPVFWINSKVSVSQVRGGNDNAATHPYWAHGAYQIREGESARLTKEWLIALGASYIVVHGITSQDPFHDFKQREKFADFSLVASDGDDFLYSLKEAEMGRITSTAILTVPKPINGKDEEHLAAYVATIKRPASVVYLSSDRLQIRGETKKGEAFSLAISYDPSWVITKGDGNIKKDAFGNIVVLTKREGDQTIILTYKRHVVDEVIGIIFTVFFITTLVFFDTFYLHLTRMFPSISFAISDEIDEE